jgi:FkbM family methyltransferase
LAESLFISHAQNLEDVILWRALKHVVNGFYIDIGAHDPCIDSVSLAFYQRGWRGAHVEPLPNYAAQLREARRDEEVIEAAIALSPGQLTLYVVPAWDALSTGNRALGMAHAAAGRSVSPVAVKALPLGEILDKYRGKDIHWLKIDVEGMEDEVIASWPPSLARPWIVLIESTVPLSSTPSHQDWESNLLDLGYTFAYFDGLNRFYVSEEHPDLAAKFGPGPNLTDNFTLNGTATAPFATKLQTEKRESAAKVHALNAELRAARSDHDAVKKELATERKALAAKMATLERHHSRMGRRLSMLYRSTSWRLTRPIRLLGYGLKRLFRRTSRMSVASASVHELARR